MSKNIHVYGLNINNEKKLKKILEKISLGSNLNFFDVIIDDGSHYLSDILFSLKILFRHLRKGGIYIIEDFKYPNYYGIDVSTETELIASNKSISDIEKELGVEKVMYQNVDDLLILFRGLNEGIMNYETSLFDGNYIV